MTRRYIVTDNANNLITGDIMYANSDDALQAAARLYCEKCMFHKGTPIKSAEAHWADHAPVLVLFGKDDKIVGVKMIKLIPLTDSEDLAIAQ